MLRLIARKNTHIAHGIPSLFLLSQNLNFGVVTHIASGQRCNRDQFASQQQFFNLRSFSSKIFLPGTQSHSSGLEQERSFAHLGIVDQLRDEVAITLPPTQSRFWEVLEFRPDGAVLETWKSPDALGLHPRDVHLFASQGMAQPAMIAPRAEAILVRTEFLKAIVFSDRAVLFPAKRQVDTVRIAQAVKSSVSQSSALPFEFRVLESLLSETSRAFEVRVKRLGMVAEAVLEDINKNFHASVAELHRLIPVTRKLTEIQNDVKETLDAIGDILNDDAQLQAMCLTEKKRAVRLAAQKEKEKEKGKEKDQTQDEPSIKQQQDDNIQLRESVDPGKFFYSSHAYQPQQQGGPHQHQHHSPPPHPSSPLPLPPYATAKASSPRTVGMLMGSRILESYEHKMMGSYGALKEMLDNIEQAQSVWHMQLDHQRNRVLRLNLMISIFSLSGLIVTIPAAAFGMNLVSGLEGVEGLFWPVVQYSLLTGFSIAGGFYFYFRYGPRLRYQARLRDMRSLRDLLFFHMDDLEEVIEAIKKSRGVVSKKEFSEIVRKAIKERPMSPDEISLLFRVFDTNKDAVLELSELVKLEDHLEEYDNMSHHTS